MKRLPVWVYGKIGIIKYANLFVLISLETKFFPIFFYVHKVRKLEVTTVEIPTMILYFKR